MVPKRIDYLTAIEAMPPGAVLTLDHVSWEEYDELLEELDERPFYRLTYDNGRLEVMTVSAEHEIPAGLIPHLILVLAEELNLNFLSLRSTTLRKRKKAKGKDPDDCYYFKEFKKISGKKRLDLSVDPPPDLALEVDITHGSLNKFPIYAAVGVPELWRHDGKKMEFYRLIERGYVEIDHSDLFPFLAPDVVLAFLQRGETEGAIVMVKEFRKWVKASKS
ncbi:MAG: Uma2 family endonuclease [Blastocatellia bacterium]